MLLRQSVLLIADECRVPASVRSTSSGYVSLARIYQSQRGRFGGFNLTSVQALKQIQIHLKVLFWFLSLSKSAMNIPFNCSCNFFFFKILNLFALLELFGQTITFKPFFASKSYFDFFRLKSPRSMSNLLGV